MWAYARVGWEQLVLYEVQSEGAESFTHVVAAD